MGKVRFDCLDGGIVNAVFGISSNVTMDNTLQDLEGEGGREMHGSWCYDSSGTSSCTINDAVSVNFIQT